MDVSSAPPGRLVRLGLGDTAEIAAFLNRVWQARYGPQAIPLFSTAYLDWIYGGPYAADNVLLGYRIGDELAGYRALLRRSLRIGGAVCRAHVSTHLAVSPALPAVDRAAAVRAVAAVYSFAEGPGGVPPGWDGPVDALISFFDAAKESERYQRINQERMREAGVERVKGGFRHAVVVPSRVAATRCATPTVPVRPATMADAPAIAALLARHSQDQPVGMAENAEWVGHHWFAYPASAAFVIDGDDGLAGALCCYALDTVSGSGTTRRRVALLEYLLTDDTVGHAAGLVHEALAFAHREGARGLVAENTTYLSPATCEAAGLLPSARCMVAALASRPVVLDSLDRFLLDVK